MAMFTLGLVFVGCALRLRRKLSVRAVMYRSHVHNYRKTNWKIPRDRSLAHAPGFCPLLIFLSDGDFRNLTVWRCDHVQ